MVVAVNQLTRIRKNAVKKADKNLPDNAVYHESGNIAKLGIQDTSVKIGDIHHRRHHRFPWPRFTQIQHNYDERWHDIRY
jgi:hypothetical protein